MTKGHGLFKNGITLQCTEHGVKDKMLDNVLIYESMLLSTNFLALSLSEECDM